MGGSLFAAYDPLDIKNAKYLIVASSDYLYTPRSLFWPDLIFLTAPKLNWGQAKGMAISVQRNVSPDPQVIIIAGSNDHLHSRGLLTRLTKGSVRNNEVMRELTITLLYATAEVDTSVRQRFTKNVVKMVFILSPGYATLPEPLQLVYTMVTTLAVRRFDVTIPAPIGSIDPNTYQYLRSELPAVWADFSNAINGIKEHRRTHVVLDDVLGLKLSNFASLLKLRPGVNGDHVLVQQVAIDLCFRQVDYEKNAQEKMVAESDVIRRRPAGTGL